MLAFYYTNVYVQRSNYKWRITNIFETILMSVLSNRASHITLVIYQIVAIWHFSAVSCLYQCNTILKEGQPKETNDER